MRMFDLLEMKLIKYRDISEDTCMLVDEKVISFSKAVRCTYTWMHFRLILLLFSIRDNSYSKQKRENKVETV